MNQTEENKPFDYFVRERFLSALNLLIQEGKIKSYYSFCSDNGIDHSNFARIRKRETCLPSFNMISILSDQYKISVNWMISGKGEMI